MGLAEMTAKQRIERALARTVAEATEGQCPPRLRAAIEHAVFPGGARLRPRLLLAVARACGEDEPELGDDAAAAIELLHCASLVHDDLPCFDDAALRRGRATVHEAYGEPLALLCGDSLIVLAFDALSHHVSRHPLRASRLLRIVARAVGPREGIVAGQAWECDDGVGLAQYHRAKTGALFEAAVSAGAAAAGADPGAWQGLGFKLGEAYQVADDIADVMADPRQLGKPTGVDQRHGRPSALRQLGIEGALARRNQLLGAAVQAVPACPGREALQQQFRAIASRHTTSGRRSDDRPGEPLRSQAP